MLTYYAEWVCETVLKEGYSDEANSQARRKMRRWKR